MINNWWKILKHLWNIDLVYIYIYIYIYILKKEKKMKYVDFND